MDERAGETCSIVPGETQTTLFCVPNVPRWSLGSRAAALQLKLCDDSDRISLSLRDKTFRMSTLDFLLLREMRGEIRRNVDPTHARATPWGMRRESFFFGAGRSTR